MGRKSRARFSDRLSHLEAGAKRPVGHRLFHAQQCVEKYAKAMLVLRQVSFPKTHDIEQLVKLLPAGHGLNISRDEQHRLTEYATESRYPGGRDLPLAEARQAVALARRIRQAVRKLLPKKCLTPKNSKP
jgi:HEPN domain-containing protein